MADRNICDVELLDSMSENTNVLIEEDGSLKKLNLKDEIDNKILIAKNEIEAKQNKSFASGYLHSNSTIAATNVAQTIPLTKYYFSGDAFDVVDGKITILKDCTVVIMGSVYLYEGYNQYDIINAYINVSGAGGSADVARAICRTIGANPYTTLNLNTIRVLSQGDTVSLSVLNQNGTRGIVAAGWNFTYLTIHEL